MGVIDALDGEAQRLLREARVAHLATADAAGRPHLVPVVFAWEGDRICVPFDHKPKRSADPNALRRVRNIRENPRASLLVDHYEEAWSRLAWVRLDGRAEIVTGGPTYAEGAAALTRKYPQYRERPLPPAEAGLLILLHVETARAWRA